MPRTAVIVVNYGSSALLEQNVPASTTADDVVVIVDSHSTDAERARVLELGARHGWLVVTPDTNTGFGTGMNLGVARALTESVTSLVLLNPDASFPPNERASLTARVEADPLVLLAPRIVRSDGGPWMSDTMDLRLRDGTMRSSRKRRPGEAVMVWVSGAVMVLSTELWHRVGGFDDAYFLYWEDVDLCRRVAEVGGRVAVDTGVVAVHDEGGTHADGGGRAKSESFYFHNIRNRALFASRWLPARDRLRWALLTPASALDTVLTGGRRQFLTSTKPWRAYARGVAHALALTLRPGGPSCQPHPGPQEAA